MRATGMVTSAAQTCCAAYHAARKADVLARTLAVDP